MTTTTSNRGHFLVKVLGPQARAVRFLKPDLIRDLGYNEPLTDSGLYRDLHESVLASLAPGETVVLNFRRVKPFVTSCFYRLLLCLRKAVHERRGRLVLCRLNPHMAEFFDVVQAHRIFTVVKGERDALRVLTVQVAPGPLPTKMDGQSD